MTGPLARCATGAPLMLAGVAFLLLTANAVAYGDEKKSEPQQAPSATQHGGMMTGDQTAETSDMVHHSASGPRLLMPMMNSARGRKLFAAKGCVTCHSINGVGGEDAPSLDAHSMQPYMNPFDFAARMWRGAAAMIVLQEEAMGGQIEFTGDELADIIAFVHDEEEQHKFSEADIPPEIMPMMDHIHGEPGGGAAAHAEEIGHEHGHGEGTTPHDD
ncbi:MAG: cytochrome c [Alphaproteobacteria bacterium]